jgi:uncharacterized protein (TIRG00374 family)
MRTIYDLQILPGSQHSYGKRGRTVEIPRVKLQKVLKYTIFFFIILGLLLAFSNLRKFKEHFLSMDVTLLFFSLLLTLIVYIFEGIFTKISLKVFDESLPLIPSFKYSFIINAFGYLVSLGGLAHFATQIYVLDFHNINARKATLSRALHLIYFNIFFAIFLIAGFSSLLLNKERQELHLALITAVVSFVLLILGGFFLAIFWKPFQDTASVIMVRFLNGMIKVFTKKFKIENSWIQDLLRDLNEGFFKLARKPRYLLLIIGATAIIWVLWIGVNYLTFLTFGYTINIWYLVTGFSIGQVIGVLSMVPGGVGTMEGSMALVFVALGVPLETALGAIILFRLSFYIFPFFLSLPLYFSLKKNSLEMDR